MLWSATLHCAAWGLPETATRTDIGLLVSLCLIAGGRHCEAKHALLPSDAPGILTLRS